MKIQNVFLLIYLLLFIPTIYSQTGVTKAEYLQTIKEKEAELWQSYNSLLEKWQNSDPATRDSDPPKAGRHLVRMPAFLYKIMGDKKYAEHARTILLNQSYGDAYYTVRAIEEIQDSGILSKADLEIIEKQILESAERAVLYWVEWGAMNHATQSLVNNLAAAMKYFPKHPDFNRWQQKLDINISASWGLWSIEDSQIYIPAWNKPLIQYAELAGNEK